MCCHQHKRLSIAGLSVRRIDEDVYERLRRRAERRGDGRRRLDLGARFEQFLSRGFDQRIVSFDEPAARVYGALMAHRQQAGAPLASLDGQIAAIAQVHGFAVATRNIEHFADCGVEIVNPFVAS